MFDWQKPTAMMLGRWQPWHAGHTELFCRALSETGQVAILIRDVGGIIGRDAGAGRTNVQEDNPFSAAEAIANIEVGLDEAGFTNNKQYIIMMVPNITNICYGRGVGYKIEEIELSKEIQEISATKIRAKMREDGKLK